MVYGPTHGDQASREALLKDYGNFILNIDSAPVLKFRGTKDVVMTPGPRAVFPTKAAKMITTANAMMQHWVVNDKAAYGKCVTSDIKMTIPAYGLEIVGLDGIWSVRESMGAAKLRPHTCDSHTFPDGNTVKCFAHVIDPSTGARVQLSECTFTFDASNDVVVHYHQENLFMA
jgi:hypothetical protein